MEYAVYDRLLNREDKKRKRKTNLKKFFVKNFLTKRGQYHIISNVADEEVGESGMGA